MKKVKLLIVAMCVVAMAATGALAASSITVTQPSGGTVTDFRLTSPTGGYLVGPAAGNVYADSIVYAFGSTLTGISSFTFKLTNAKFAANTTYYMMKETNATTHTVTQIGASNLLASAGDTVVVNGSATLQLLPGDKVYLTQNTVSPYAKGMDMINVIMNQGLTSGSTVNIAVTQVTNSLGQSVVDGIAGAATVYTLADGLAITKGGDATKTINVNDSRETFVGTTPAEQTTSDTTLSLNTQANGVVNHVTAGASDTWLLTLKGSLQGVKSLAIGGATAVDITDAERAAGQVSRTGAGNSPAWSASPQHVVFNLFPAGERVPLDTRSFTYSFDDNGTAVVSDATFVTWGINGAQFYVPNVKVKVWSNLLVTNTAGISGNISADLTTNLGTVVTIDLGTIGANTVRAIGPADFKAALGDDFDAAQASALFTVTIPADKCFVQVYTGSKNNRIDVPIFTPPTNEAWK